MKNHKEIFTALLDGESLSSKVHKDIVCLNNDGRLINKEGEPCSRLFEFVANWEIKPKEITITKIEIKDAFNHMMSMVKYNFTDTDYARDMVRDSIDLLFNNKENEE